MSKLTINELREIIFEELRALQEVSDEDLERLEDGKKLGPLALSLLKALKEFKEKATPEAIAAIGEDNISSMEDAVHNIASHPSSYVTKVKPVVRKKISLKPVV